jgi:hypothetical protein
VVGRPGLAVTINILLDEDDRLYGKLSILNPGESRRFLIYAAGSKSPVEALSTAERIVAAHEVDWVQLWSLTWEQVGRGKDRDGYRWVLVVEARSREAAPEVEAML